MALDRIRRLFGSGNSIRVHLLIRGRIGEGWLDIDRMFKVPADTTLGSFIEHVEKAGVSMREALASSPHLEHTLMLNGERCPIDEHRERVLEDGDAIYLLAPLAGG